MILRHVSGGPLDTDIVNTLGGLLMLGLAIGVVGMIILVAATRRQPGSIALGESVAVPAGLFLVGASLIHFAAAPHHIEEWLPFGIAFVSLAVVQGALGVAYFRGVGGRRLDALALAICLGTLVVWVWSRTTGLPLGPLANQPEGIAGSDVAAAVFELAVIVIAAARLGRLPVPALVTREHATIAQAFTLSAVGLITILVVTAPTGTG